MANNEYTSFMIVVLAPAVLAVTCAAAWVTAVWMDISNNLFWWTVADIVLSPVGVLRGFMYWFGVL